jgi:predicted acylesterase/phospholipase RssA/CRP-like cAMP-binding protein
MQIAAEEVEQAFRLLRGIEALTLMPDLALRELAVTCGVVWAEPGTVIVQEGEAGDATFLVSEGQVELRVATAQGERTVETLGHGRGIGLVQMLSGGVRTETAVAVSRCKLYRLSRRTFQQFAARHPEVERAVQELVKLRTRALHLAALLEPLVGGLEPSEPGPAAKSSEARFAPAGGERGGTHEPSEPGPAAKSRSAQVSEDARTERDLRQRVASEGGEHWPGLRAQLVSQVHWVELPRGEVLYEVGDPADSLYMVVNGRLRCDRGTEGVIEVGRGDLQGEISLLAGTPRTSTVTALRDCLLARIDAATFTHLLAASPQLSLGLARSLASRVATHQQRRTQARGCMHLAFLPVSRGFALPRLVRALAEHLGQLGRTLVLDTDALARHGVLDNAERLAVDHPSWIRFQAWLDRVEAEHAFVLYVCDPDAVGWTRRCVDGADRLVMVAQAGEQLDPRGVVAAGPRRNNDAPRTLALLHTPDTARPTQTRRWLEAVPVDAHYHVRNGILAEEARLARLLTGRAIGLTLGGGGARGLAHIGVIRAMNELDIPIDHVGGTSMGAIIAAQHAMGMTPEEMVHLNLKLARLKPFSDYTLPVISLLRTRRIEESARMSFGNTDIEDLWLPYFAVSTNLTQASMVVHDRGPVWVATRASGSLPGIAVPVLVARELLVDGGVLNNIPADVMRQRAGGQVVAVDVSPRVDQRFQLERLPGPTRWLLDRLAGRARQSSPTIVDILLRTTTLASSQHSERMRREVDLLLKPPVDKFGLLDFDRLVPIVNTGYRYAFDALSRWSVAKASA